MLAMLCYNGGRARGVCALKSSSYISIDLEKGFSLFLLVIGVQLDVELLNQLLCLVFLEVHDGIKHLQND